MKKKVIHADKYQIQTQPGMTAEKKVTQGKNYAAKARLNTLGFNNDEIKVVETGVMEEIAKMLVRHKARLGGKKVIPTKHENGESKGKSFTELNNRVKTPSQPCFVYAHEEIEAGIRDGEYTTIEECKRNRYFLDCLADDQLQLLGIAKKEFTKKLERIIHTPKAYGDWKCTDFICVLEDIQMNIQNGKYTTIEQCMEICWFSDCDKEDQEQLIDIANWYLYNAQQEADALFEAEEVKSRLSQEEVHTLLLAAAEEAMASGEDNVATEMFAAILKKYPNAMDIKGNGYFYYRRGLGESMKGRFTAAVADYTRAIELEGVDLNSPKDSTYLLERGYAKYRNNDFPAAKIDWKLALAKDPANVKSWLELYTSNEYTHLNEIFNSISEKVKIRSNK